MDRPLHYLFFFTKLINATLFILEVSLVIRFTVFDCCLKTECDASGMQYL